MSSFDGFCLICSFVDNLPSVDLLLSTVYVYQIFIIVGGLTIA